MAISDDFTFDPENRLVTHSSGTTVYTVNQLYTYAQDLFDEIMLLSYSVPMSAQTPSEYSLVNGWFMPEESTRFLSGGAIKTIGHDAASYSDGVYILRLDNLGYVGCSPADIGKTVTCSGTSGRLLSYNNTIRKWWVRREVGTTWTGSATISGGGAGTVLSAATGETLFANMFTLGELEQSTTNTLYIQQINPDLTNDKIEQFWGNGHIDVLLKVKEANSLIDSGKVTVYCREYGNLYSHYIADMSSGGRNPVPLSTLSDSNNLTASGTVNGWTDVTVTFGPITRDIGDGVMRPYDAEIDCGNRTSLNQVYERLKLITARTAAGSLNGALGSFYRAANQSYFNVLQSPFGTYSGGRFYGARGIWLKNIPYVDTNDYQLTDSNDITVLQKYTSLGTLIFDSNLTDVTDTAVYRLFFKQISDAAGQRKFGMDSAVIVLKDDNLTQVSGEINSTAVQFDFDYDGNMQAAWLPSHSYAIDDEFRYLGTWYRVSTAYTSAGTFGATDTSNAAQIEGPTVVLVAVGRTKAQYVSAIGTLARTTENKIQVDAMPELNFVT